MWEELPISEICTDIIDCVNKTAPSVDYETPFKMIRTTNVRDGYLNLSNVKYVTKDTFEKWTRRGHLKKNDIILTREAPLGEVCRIRDEEDIFLGQRTMLYRANEDIADSIFLFYSFLSPYVYHQIKAFGMGATVEHMRVPDAGKFKIPLPPLPIQKKIASILSTYDDLIENNFRRIELLEQTSRELYKEWFVRFKVPGHEKVQIIDGLPEGWEMLPVPDAISINPRTKVHKDRVNKYVPMSSLSTDSMVIESYEEKESNSGSKFMNKDTLLARITPCLENGKTGFVDFLEEDESAIGSTEFIVLREKLVPPEFIYCLSRTYNFREKAIKSMVGSSGRQRVQVSCFDDYFIPVPPKNILDDFIQKTQPQFNQIMTLTKKNQLLKQARDLILPRLMKGEIEV